MASLRDAGCVSSDDPVVSLRSTTGYRLRSRWDHSDFTVSDHIGDIHQMTAIGTTDAEGIPSYTHNNEKGPTAIGTTGAGGIPSCSRWSSAATPPDPKVPEFSTPAGVPANVHASGRLFEHHFPDVRKMVPAGHSERIAGISNEARELDARIAENVVELLEA